jgi:hypothetical protein
VTAFVLIGGLFVVSRFLSEPEVTATQEVLGRGAPHPGGEPHGTECDGSLGQDTEHPSDVADRRNDRENAAASVDSPSGVEESQSAAPTAGTEAASEAPSAPAEVAAAPAATSAHADARTIMQESQRRSEAKFYRYDGLLQSFDSKNKMPRGAGPSRPHQVERTNKSVLRFTAPPGQGRGAAHLAIGARLDQWMWTRHSNAIAASRCRIGPRGSSELTSASRISRARRRAVTTRISAREAIRHRELLEGSRRPKKSRASHYTHSIAWIRKDNYVMTRLDNYVDDEVVKRLTNSSIENIQGIWTARQLEIADLKRATRTRLTLQQVKYNDPMKDGDFTLEAIRR